MKKNSWITELEKEIKKYEIVSFDIFDTLLKRNCFSPQVIFDVVEEQCNLCFGYKTDFKRKRYSAEVSLYKSGILTPSLKDIYEKIDMEEIEKRKAIELEKETEIKFACANKPIYDIYVQCKESSKQIYAISDMYLPKGTIKKMLRKSGYDIPDILISAELNANKSSGKLYMKFLNKFHINAEEALHIGDNYKADILGATKAKINSFLIPQYIKNTFYYKKKRTNTVQDDNILYAFINNHLPFIQSRKSQIGYETQGPMIFGFCQWLHNIKKTQKIDKLFFCARDVYQTMNIYKKLYPNEKEELEYLCISLKSLKMPYEAACGDNNTVEAKEQLDLIGDYLKQIGCTGKIAVVDSGYGGHTYQMLKTILGEKCELKGFYMRMSKKFTKRAAKREAWAYMFSERPSAKSYIAGAFFETMLSATHGRTLSYKRSTNNIVEPVFGDDNPQAELINEFQYGIECFVEQWRSFTDEKHLIPNSAIQDAFLRFAFYPLKSDVDLLYNITGGNEAYSEIVLSDNIVIWKNPLTYMKLLKDTYWKGGFLCKTIKNYKPICKIYLFLDEILLNLIGF